MCGDEVGDLGENVERGELKAEHQARLSIVVQPGPQANNVANTSPPSRGCDPLRVHVQGRYLELRARRLLSTNLNSSLSPRSS